MHIQKEYVSILTWIDPEDIDDLANHLNIDWVLILEEGFAVYRADVQKEETLSRTDSPFSQDLLLLYKGVSLDFVDPFITTYSILSRLYFLLFFLLVRFDQRLQVYGSFGKLNKAIRVQEHKMIVTQAY